MHGIPRSFGLGSFITLVGLVLMMSAQPSVAAKPAPVVLPPLPPTEVVKCKTSLDRSRGGKLAAGLVLTCTVQVDSAADYEIIGQLYQDSLRGPIAYADGRGRPQQRELMTEDHTIRVRATKPGPLQLTLWFPASGIRRNARAGSAWAEVEVLLEGSPPPMTHEELLARRARWYACPIEKLDPADFKGPKPSRTGSRPLAQLVSR